MVLNNDTGGSPRYMVNRDRKRPQNTAYFGQNITNFRVILQVGGGFSHQINYLICFY